MPFCELSLGSRFTIDQDGSGTWFKKVSQNDALSEKLRIYVSHIPANEMVTPVMFGKR